MTDSKVFNSSLKLKDKWCFIHMNRFRIADWRMFHAGPTHSGAGTGSPLLSPSLYWKFNTATGLAVRSSPAVVVGDFYRGEGGYVIAGAVYIGSDDGNVYALNAATGIPLWKYVTGGPVSSSPAVVNGVVYVGSSDGYVYALGTQSYPFTDL
jgi:outer membrane protein assembly factor BamB